MSEAQKRREVELARGVQLWGEDFFMVDPRDDVHVKAASFHIMNDQDKRCFIRDASPFIPWVACKTPSLVRVMAAAAGASEGPKWVF